jgi:hypothetical protein
MFAKSTIAALALFASYVVAQGTTANSTIDPSTVSDTDKCESLIIRSSLTIRETDWNQLNGAPLKSVSVVLFATAPTSQTPATP